MPLHNSHSSLQIHMFGACGDTIQLTSIPSINNSSLVITGPYVSYVRDTVYLDTVPSKSNTVPRFFIITTERWRWRWRWRSWDGPSMTDQVIVWMKRSSCMRQRQRQPPLPMSSHKRSIWSQKTFVWLLICRIGRRIHRTQWTNLCMWTRLPQQSRQWQLKTMQIPTIHARLLFRVQMKLICMMFSRLHRLSQDVLQWQRNHPIWIITQTTPSSIAFTILSRRPSHYRRHRDGRGQSETAAHNRWLPSCFDTIVIDTYSKRAAVELAENEVTSSIRRLQSSTRVQPFSRASPTNIAMTSGGVRIITLHYITLYYNTRSTFQQLYLHSYDNCL